MAVAKVVNTGQMFADGRSGSVTVTRVDTTEALKVLDHTKR